MMKKEKNDKCGDKMTISKKIEENKEEKETNILNSGFELFTEKGVKKTSVQDITSKAGVAKGTFYLYFKDKYELQERLIAAKSNLLLKNALEYTEKKNIKDYKERIISIVDYIINEFTKNRLLLRFISKNLSMGILSTKWSYALKETEESVLDKFKKDCLQNNINLKNPEVTFFMIIELVSSMAFSSITVSKPLPINELKPYLYDEIRKMLSV